MGPENDTGDFKGGKVEGLALMEKLNARLEMLQEALLAEHKHKVLVILLQAMDTGGKDGLIRRVSRSGEYCGGAASFKAPTAEEESSITIFVAHPDKQVPGQKRNGHFQPQAW
ncbi:hypothetical protein [Candidatus Villigracilis saccharophilus]|uniref:hypothetical protein n=1 Tax=Candidatus Villigracilis saccharophilus TaxID=3140684 RepID=UPI0031360E58|nr:hypothetical protein [Anaerolineales bacterium]